MEAVSVALPQKVPDPLAVTVVGGALTVIVAVLLPEGATEHPDAFFMEEIVTVVLPEFARVDVLNVPVLVPIVNVAVFPVAVFTPLRL